ncbi:MAG: endonuclease [Nitrospinaceae bacterium]|nr:endonuclease [Nitrospinaceae bacterium]MBT3432511.1 endonuclease [Nitrospinaceae bacterium]MBT3821448.1 endonuclease [Nitrospinaceae bacterium]MBT4095197.1 endonuclease [Nitrospinaceae bacterium]MBT4429993.1 endonuclease [Nitrospinaceae bacterium]
MPKKRTGLYDVIIEQIFKNHFTAGISSFDFDRDEIEKVAEKIEANLPKNVGDVVYSFRYRRALPKSIQDTASNDNEWVIEGADRAKYTFKLVKINRIVPNQNLIAIKIPDATPEIISSYALSDEQALLAKVRYNRLVDIFLGLTTYSLQNHLRTTVKRVQIEIDEIYVGIDREGCHYIIPIQAKGGKDQLSVVQTKQDISCCTDKFPNLICRALSSQFMTENLIAIFELTVQDDQIRIVDEKHYRLVPSEQISSEDMKAYRSHTSG